MPEFVAPAGGGTAGVQRATLLFTNKAKKACAVRGFPELIFIGKRGYEGVGSPFRHVRGGTPESILLEPDDQAYVTLLIPDPGVAGPGCVPVESQGIAVALAGTGDRKVYAERAAIVCAAEGTGVAEVGFFVKTVAE
ncbi:DUF4232 domain-containing protein [Catenuloplanes japonicus]|uniref:DUF4232 domain-containing protein n=1 Tax=Catenuloplanes japonicus TaxID=33876 RepID=UPI0006913648|nr:DUF4232 domain-containing protein [Catenuloplanes japonicus]